MNEEQRAEWLARAIEDLLRGVQPPKTPEFLDENEVQGLIAVARARLKAAREAGQAGLNYEALVWKRVLGRLDATAQGATGSPDSSEQGTTEADPEDGEANGLRDIIDLRRKMAEDIASFAEIHRADVWRQVLSRLCDEKPRKAGIFSFWRDNAPGWLSPAIDGIALGQGTYLAQSDDIIEAARARKGLSRLMHEAAAASESGIWSRIRYDVSRSRMDAATRNAALAKSPWLVWPRLAAVAAGLALIIAAVGPLPATGLAHHPAVELANYVGDHVGISAQDSPPPAPGAGTLVQGRDLTIEQATSQMGLPLAEPSRLPSDFQRLSSRYFPQGLTSNISGVFVLTYTTADGAATLTAYQEADGGSPLAVDQDAVASGVQLADGSPATYFAGAWRTADGSFSWSDAGSQTLLFSRAGIRTIIEYKGPAIAPSELQAVAGSMTATD